MSMPPSPLIETTSAHRCTVCGTDLASGHLLAEGQDYEYETCANVWRMWRCPRCTHIQLNPRPADSTLGVIYPPHYYSYNMGESVSAFALWCKSLMDKNKFRGLLRHVRRQPRSFLDVGCGDGRYLELMMRRGLSRDKVHGLELEKQAVEKACARGLNVRQCRIEDADHLEDGQIDMATMFHVIEHLADPGDVIKTLGKKIAEGGTLVIETPNADALDALIFKNRFWGGYHFPRHWHIFTPRSLNRLLTQNGFEPRHFQYQPGHAFWLFSFHHWLKYGCNLPRLARLFHPLRSIPGLAFVVLFDKLRALLGFRTSAMLIVAVKKPH